MAGEWLRFLAVLLLWCPSAYLLYEMDVREALSAAAGWDRVFSPGVLEYDIFIRDASGKTAPLGTLKRETVVEGDRASVFSSLSSRSRSVFISSRLLVSREGGFISASAEASVFGREYRLQARRTGDIITIRVEHPGGTVERRLPAGAFSAGNAAGLAGVPPFRDLPDFRPGMRWRAFVFDISSGRLRPAEAGVVPRPSRVSFRGERIRVFRAFLKGLPDFRAWYLPDGRVLRETFPIGPYTLVLERKPEK